MKISAKILVLMQLPFLLLLPSQNSQASLITNGGFETGDLTGWTCRFAFFCQAVPSGVGAAPPAHSGDYLFGGNTFRFDGILAQEFATVAGQGYELSFFSIVLPGDEGMFFKYEVDGIEGRPAQVGDWLNTTANFFASSNTTTIRFIFSTDEPGQGPVGLDDIFVERVGPILVSIPPSLALFSLALAVLGWSRRKYR